MLLLISLPFAFATAPSADDLMEKINAVNLQVPVQTITFDADRINRLGMGMYGTEPLTLVPGFGQRGGTLAGHSRNDVSVMLDGVVLRSENRLGPLP